jgi:diguanylate cyclase (GGDEF)-like protein
LTGYTAEEVVGRNARIHSSGEHPSKFYDLLWATIRAGRVWHGEMTNRRKDGTLYRDEMRISPVVDADGQIIHYIAIKRDVSNKRERDVSIVRALEFAQGTIDALSSNICVLDEVGNIIAVNRAWKEFAGENQNPNATRIEASGDGFFAQGINYLELCERATGEDAEVAIAFASGIRAILRMEQEQFCAEYPCHSPEKKRWFMGRVTRFQTARPVRILIEHIDITERRLAEDALLFKNALLEGQTETTLDGILAVDDANHIFLANSQFAMQFGIPPEILSSGDDLTLRHFIRKSLDDPDVFFKRVAAIVSNRAAKTSDEIRLKNGRIFDRYSAPLSDSNGQYRGRVWYYREITERKASEARIESLAYYDVLTTLPNRYLMQSRLEATLAGSRASGGRAALLFLDLDRFKIFNDSLGHGFGDLLLKEIAGRLQTCLEDEHFIARIGGDEFLIVLDDIEDQEAVSKVAVRVLNSIGRVLEVQGRSINIHCSIGISIFPEHGTNAEELIKNADAAMFRAKDSGRNKYQFFTKEIEAQALKRLTLENDLHLALDRDEFFLVYQPQMNIAQQRISGFEALIRWRHPKLGLTPPDEFIEIAESSGLILPIGEWVLRTACRQARQWQKNGLLTGSIAVNVSAVQFSDSGLVPMIRKVLSETGLRAECLELELTESLLLSHADLTSSVLRELKNLGVKLAIDDFGTGYSSLGYLKRFSVGKLKIDRSFISELTVDADDAAITTAIISMAKSLRLDVIAEGVESEEQLSFLREHGCDEIQGYLLGRPLEAEAIPAFMQHARVRWERQVLKQRMVRAVTHVPRTSRIVG